MQSKVRDWHANPLENVKGSTKKRKSGRSNEILRSDVNSENLAGPELLCEYLFDDLLCGLGLVFIDSQGQGVLWGGMQDHRDGDILAPESHHQGVSVVEGSVFTNGHRGPDNFDQGNVVLFNQSPDGVLRSKLAWIARGRFG